MTQNNELAEFEAVFRPQINAYLHDNIPRDVNESTLAEAMSYSVDAGGKRLRPLLSLAVLTTFGQAPTEAELRAICALELLHTYSLIHDDLPAMDDDALRRGEPTNHVKFGPGMATLAGDGLLTLAFQWLSDSDVSTDKKIQLVQALTRAAGPSGMVAGQALDVENTHHRLTLPELRTLHREKTGALIHYAVEAGTILAETAPSVRDGLLAYADDFGLAFQIYDDILDVTSSPEKMGKATQKDAAEEKNTYPSLVGLAESQELLDDTVSRAKEHLIETAATFGFSPDLLLAFLSYFG
ncbi:polyprenyl synthetase family protein [Levilactobacillus bambusae]|uniref:Farnesyl diphosphate synthase n=1 Tax=Levilactobacillus bambusae TaxID=2024736 RepID=A0A2V1N313_9LACO|nr:farnesyl diphosphate synthase [Levilactobacillus bambusae]PWG00928.1 polyprenyl synthetase family protein [Levilactobacillus bambusae]